MYKLIFTLKQHTPLIHFQHDQDGATLRASEVKPKLDRYLIKKLQLTEIVHRAGKDIEVPKTEYKSWFNSEEHLSLDYKMRVFTNDNSTEYFITSYLSNNRKELLERSGINTIHISPYFAQEEYTKKIFQAGNTISQTEWNSIPKKGIMRQVIQLFVLCFKIELLTKISENIHEFFVCENFGTRQSKGFGCFEIISPTPVKKIENYLKDNFKFVYKKTINSLDFKNIFEEIQHDYKLLRSGRNMDGRHRPYAKSKLFLYGLKMDTPVRWEKRFLKLNLHDVYYVNKDGTNTVLLQTQNRHSSNYGDGNNNQSWDDPQKFNYKYLRAVLGYSEQFEFMIENFERKKFKVKISKNEIERFKSPLLFKVINNTVYLVGNEISSITKETLEGVKFEFNILLDLPDDFQIEDTLEDTLEIPKNFSLPAFMKFAMENNTNGASLGYTTIKE